MREDLNPASMCASYVPTQKTIFTSIRHVTQFMRSLRLRSVASLLRMWHARTDQIDVRSACMLLQHPSLMFPRTNIITLCFSNTCISAHAMYDRSAALPNCRCSWIPLAQRRNVDDYIMTSRPSTSSGVTIVIFEDPHTAHCSASSIT
jgi:hypothetical protein